MSKILLIDIDGTLVDYENRLPASAVDAPPRPQSLSVQRPQQGREQAGDLGHRH